MRTLASKDKSIKSMTMPKVQRPKRNPTKSLKSAEVNKTLAKINLLRTQFDNALTVLGSTRGRNGTMDDNLNVSCDLVNLPVLNPTTNDTNNGQHNLGDKDLNDPCNHALPTEKNNQITPPVSPTGIAQQMSNDPSSSSNDSLPSSTTSTTNTTNGSPQDHPPTPVRGVHINETPTLESTTTIPPKTTHPQRLILQSTHQYSTNTIDINDTGPCESRPKEIHDHTKMLLRVHSKDGMKEIYYHVENFADLSLVWPIIEFSMSPTCSSKDEKMTSFTKCVMALHGKILYVDDTAMIAPLMIFNNNKDNYITKQTDLPTNFTKLGKYIMIGGGSLVFNKKEKGSNNVYARFQLKSLSPMEEVVSHVSFEFTRLGRNNLYKKQHQGMETETLVMLLFVCNGTDQGSIKSNIQQMLKIALDDIEVNGMVIEEIKNKDSPHFTIKLKPPCIQSKTKPTNNKA